MAEGITPDISAEISSSLAGILSASQETAAGSDLPFESFSPTQYGGFPALPGVGLSNDGSEEDGSDATDSQILNGDASANVLDGQGNYAVVVGGGGGDTIIFGQGYGPLTIDEVDTGASPNNVLQLGAGISTDSVNVSADENGDLLLSFGDNSDQILLAAALNSVPGGVYGVQQVQFADGTIWSYADLLSKVDTASGSTLELFGDRSGNELDSEGVATEATGAGGGDIFVYNVGYGALTINEVDSGPAPDNILSFGDGISSEDVSVSASSDGSLILSLGGEDRIKLAGALLSTAGLNYGVQQVTFADGTAWTYADLLIKAETPSATNTTLYGDGSANILDGEGIATELVGGGGGDTFRFANGDRPIVVDETDAGTAPANVLELVGVVPVAVSVRADAAGDLILSFGGQDQVTITGALSSSAGASYGVQQVEFDDGTTWSYSDLLAKADTASATNRALFGDQAANTLDSLGVATSVSGGGGGDTFVYDQDYGELSITETDAATSPNNILQLGSGLHRSALTVSGTAAGDIILDFGGGDKVVLKGALNSSGGTTNGVQTVQFADGFTLSYADLLTLVKTPSSGNTSIFGDTVANLLDPLGIARTITGGGGGDTIIYMRGYGAVTVDEADLSDNPDNVLQFGPGIAPADLEVTANANGDLILSLGGGDVVTLVSALMDDGPTFNGVQQVGFHDGTVWTYDDLLARADTPAATNTALYGDVGANTFDSLGIARTVIGRGGGDTIIYNAGYGALTIDESDDSGSLNVLQLGAGISSTSVSVYGTASGNIVLSFGGGDIVTITGALNNNYSTDLIQGIQRVTFADGSSWSYEDLLAHADLASVDNTTLYGDADANELDGKGIATTLVGNGGDDVFLYNQGYGALTIDEADPYGAPNNALELGAGIDPADVTVSINAEGSLILSLPGSDQITLTGALNSDETATYGVQLVAFADGTTWSYEDLIARADIGSATNTTLYGDAYSNNFDSKGQASLIVGRGGGDTFVYNRGYGALVIDESDSGDDPSNVLAFGAGITAAEVTVTSDSTGDLILTLVGPDHITLTGALDGVPGTTRGVQWVTFANGDAWSMAQLRAFASASWSVGAGSGNTIITEATDGSGNLPAIDLAFLPTDVTVTMGADHNSLTLTTDTNDSVEIQGILNSAAITHQLIHFADGTTWHLSDAVAQATIPANILNYVIGTPEAETFDLGFEPADVFGGGGGDIFNFNIGDGAVRIFEADDSVVPDNVIVFGAGITLSSISVTSDGADLILSLGVNDQITVVNALAKVEGAAEGVQSVSFADGSSATYAQLLAIADLGSATNDGTLYGDANANLFDSAGYSHRVNGQGGGDTIIYNEGYGDLNVIESDASASPQNVIAFGPGIDPSDVSVSASDLDSSLLTLTLASGGEIDLEGELSSQANGVQRVTFADGTVWTYADLLASVETPESSSTPIFGDGGANILDTAGIAHKAIGNGGGDTFVYQIGYGALEIDETDLSATPDNILQLGAGIDPNSILVTANDRGELILALGGNDRIVIDNALVALSDGTSGIQAVQFADGTLWSYADLLAKADTPSAANTALYGDDRANTLDSAGVATSVSGGGGGDTFVYERGYGSLTLSEYDGNGGINTLQLGAGIAPTDVSLAQFGSDLILSLGGNDRIFLSGQRIGGYSGVQRISFADGTVWTGSYLNGLATAPSSGSAPTIVSGSLLSGAISKNTDVQDSSAADVTSGTVAFHDVDVNDLHVLNPVYEYASSGWNSGLPSNATMLSYLSVGVATEPSGGASGTVGWSFSAPDDAFDYLRPGQSVTLDYILQLGDDHGKSVNQDITVTITAASGHANSGPVVASGSTLEGAFDELAGATGSTTVDGATGTILFTDADGGDTHSASVADIAASGSTYGLPSNSALLSFVAVAPAVEPDTSTPGSIGWSFNAADAYFDYLGAGETVTLNYSVLLSDDNGGSTAQDVAITIAGANDAPVLVAPASRSVTENGSTQLAGLGISDADSSDIETVTLTTASGSLTAASANGLSVTGSGSGTLALSGSAVIVDRALAALVYTAGAVGTDTIDISASDGSLTDTASVAVTISPAGAGGGGGLVPTLVGTAGDDSLTGTSGVDVIEGLAGNDSLYGDDGDDTLVGGTGNDHLEGRAGSDTYIYAVGDGSDEINESSPSLSDVDTLEFSNLNASDLTFTRNGDLMMIRIDATGEIVTVDNQFYNPSTTHYGLEQIVFADGTTWDRTQIQQASWIRGSDNNDSLSGGDATDDTLVGGGGDDYLNGAGGSDTYIYASGDGSDQIDDESSSLTDVDTLKLTDLNPADVMFTRNGNHDAIKVIATGETITLAWQFYNQFATHYGIDQIVFADGTTWDRTEIQQASWIRGSDNNDSLGGDDSTDDTFVGGLGNDYLSSGGGSDTFMYSSGDGSDEINEYSSSLTDIDTLKFSDLNASDVTFTRNGNLMTITIDGTGDILTIDNQFNDPLASHYGLERVVFADGTSWDRDQIAQAAWIRGTASNDTLSFSGSDATFSGGGGDDVIHTGAGNDTFVYAVGDGNDEIDDASASTTDVDILKLTDLNPADVSLSRSGVNLSVTITATGEIIQVDNQFYQPDSASWGLEQIIFADGTVWDRARISQEAPVTYGLDATSGDDILVGTNGNDTINPLDGNDRVTGGPGNDLIYESGGDDTYVWNVGDGNDVIRGSGWWDGTNTIQFGAGIAPEDLRFAAGNNGNGLLITVDGQSGSILIEDELSADPGSAIDQLSFADGTSWTHAQILAAAYAQMATSGNDEIWLANVDSTIDAAAGDDIIHARNGNDTITGGPGDDVIYESSGDDTYVWNLGDGNDVIRGSGWWDGTNTVRFGTGIAPGDLRFAAGNNGNGLLITVDGQPGSILIEDELNAGSDDAINQLSFADGTTWTRAQIISAAYAQMATPANDEIWLANVDSTIDAGAGDDIVHARSGNDTISGGTGNDLIYESGGDDTYVWNLGDGNDVIRGSGWWDGTNTIRFGTGIAPGDLRFAAGNNGSGLLITVDGQPGSILIEDELNAGSDDAINQLSFADGTTWTRAQIISAAYAQMATPANDEIWLANVDSTIDAGAGDDIVHARSGNDTISGGTGNDLIYESGGDDTYVWNLGDGNDVIRGSGWWDGTNTIQFGTGIAPEDLRFAAGNNGNGLLITLDGQPGSILIEDELSADPNSAIDQLSFADGTSWTHAQILAAAYAQMATSGNDEIWLANADSTIDAGAGDDIIHARNGNDTISGGTGDDLIYESSGDDTYVWNLGDGNDVIRGSGWWDGTNTIQLGAGIAPEDLQISYSGANGDNIRIGIAGQSGSITLEGQRNTTEGIDLIQFADGTSWNQATLLAQAATAYAGGNTLIGDNGDETLNAGGGGDTLIGHGGNDTLNGGAGSDTFVFHAGFGFDTVNAFATDGSATDTIQVDRSMFSDWAHLLGATQQVGPDLTITLDTQDIVTLKNVALASFTPSNVAFV